MRQRYSFQDTLERLWRGRKRVTDRAERHAAREQVLDYRAGLAAADKLIGRIWSSCGSAAEMVLRLRHAMRQHGDGLSGRVTRAELSKAAAAYEREDERQRPQRESDVSLIALWQRSARAHADWQSLADRGWYARRRDVADRLHNDDHGGVTVRDR